MRPFIVLRFIVSTFAGFALGGVALAQQNWEWVNAKPASSPWTAAAYGNGTYVVIGDDGTIVTSPDTATWTVRRMPTENISLNDVAYAEGRFIAVGRGSPTINTAYFLTSTDGVTWTPNATIDSSIYALNPEIAYGNGMWVVAGINQSRVLTSTDGDTWTPRAVGSATGDLAFGGGNFVALTNNNKAIVSSDGVTWTSVNIDAATTMYFSGIAYGKGRFVVGGRTSDFKSISYSSTDGTAWTAGTPVADGSGGSWVAFANDVFAMGGGGGFDLHSSTDGTTWTRPVSAFPESRKSTPNSVGTENVGGVGAANDRVFAFGIYGALTSSTDGTTWTRHGSGTSHDISGLVHDGTKFVGVGTGGTVVTSVDGSDWTAAGTNFTGWFEGLAYSNGRYVAVSMDGLWHSTDLATWTRVANTAFNQMYGVIRANGRFVATASGISAGIWVSEDGATWTVTPRPSGASGNVYGLDGADGKFLLATGGPGLAAKVFASADAATWTDVTPAGFTGTPESAACADGRFVVFANNTSWVSSDGGVAWTSHPLPATNLAQVTGVRAFNGKFLARKFPNFVTSEDGITWTDVENSTTPNVVVASVLTHGSHVYIAGGGGAILRGTLDGAPAPKTLTATVPTGATVQWLRNGADVSGATSATFTVDGVTPETAGIYTAAITNGGTTTLESTIVGVSTTEKLVGTGTEYPDIKHQNGNIFDQILLGSAAAAFTADATENQITRLSYEDMNGDIVQVEFSGAGTVTILLEGATTAAEAANYNQPGTNYLKGHATILVTGADESSNLTVFSVGSITAFNSSLFKSGVTYDGYADIAAIAILSTNGKFGTMKSGNTSFWNTRGFTGIYAPGVTFQGEIFIHDINAKETATPVFMIGGAKEARLTGGHLTQDNGRAIQIAGLTQLQLTAGTDSHGTLVDAQTNQGRLERDGVDVTAEIIR